MEAGAYPSFQGRYNHQIYTYSQFRLTPCISLKLERTCKLHTETYGPLAGTQQWKPPHHQGTHFNTT